MGKYSRAISCQKVSTAKKASNEPGGSGTLGNRVLSSGNNHELRKHPEIEHCGLADSNPPRGGAA